MVSKNIDFNTALAALYEIRDSYSDTDIIDMLSECSTTTVVNFVLAIANAAFIDRADDNFSNVNEVRRRYKGRFSTSHYDEEDDYE